MEQTKGYYKTFNEWEGLKEGMKVKALKCDASIYEEGKVYTIEKSYVGDFCVIEKGFYRKGYAGVFELVEGYKGWFKYPDVKPKQGQKIHTVFYDEILHNILNLEHVISYHNPDADWSRLILWKPVEVKKPSIDWEQVSEEYNYLAMDMDGKWFLYKNKPVLNGESWWEASFSFIEADYFSSFTEGDCEAKDSLVSRFD